MLEFSWWLVAWRRYSITAAVTNQMQFGQTVAHEAVVAEVVALGAADGYGPAIGPLYSDHERYRAPLWLCQSTLLKRDQSRHHRRRALLRR